MPAQAGTRDLQNLESRKSRLLECAEITIM